MKVAVAALLVLAAEFVAATPLTPRRLLLRNGPKCAVDGGMGVCMSTSETCVGGAFHPATAACAGSGSDAQCCIVGGSGTTRSIPNSDRTAPRAPAATPSGGPLPGLNSVQSNHAWAIVGEVQSAGVGHQGCLAAFATGLVESSIRILANKAVPASLNYPNDGLGSDHDSIGIFQQRAQFYPNIAADMDAAQSAGQFFQVMKGISGWQTMDVGTLCQKVQKSAFPDRYAAQVGAATQICNAAGIN